jgi:hypothetical protein
MLLVLSAAFGNGPRAEGNSQEGSVYRIETPSGDVYERRIVAVGSDSLHFQDGSAWPRSAVASFRPLSPSRPVPTSAPTREEDSEDWTIHPGPESRAATHASAATNSNWAAAAGLVADVLILILK